MTDLNTKLIQLTEQLATLCLRKNKMLAVAESCTGGGLSYYLTAVAGSSKWFDRGFVTYSGEAKQDLLDVPADLLKKYGEVSAQTAKAMVEGVFSHSKADYALSITGIAGPTGGTSDKPNGFVWFAWGERNVDIFTQNKTFTGNRAAVRLASIEFALKCLIELLDIDHYIRKTP